MFIKIFDDIIMMMDETERAYPAFLTKKENGVSESPTQYRFEPDFSPAPPTTVCCENLTRHRHELDLRKKELICVKFTQIN